MVAAKLLSQYAFDLFVSEDPSRTADRHLAGLWRAPCTMVGVVQLCQKTMSAEAGDAFRAAFWKRAKELGTVWSARAVKRMTDLAQMGFTNASIMCFRGDVLVSCCIMPREQVVIDSRCTSQPVWLVCGCR